MSVNGYDQFGHYLRTALLAGCNSLATAVNLPCTRQLHQGRQRAAPRAPRASSRGETPLEKHPARRGPRQGAARSTSAGTAAAERAPDDAPAGRAARPRPRLRPSRPTARSRPSRRHPDDGRARLPAGRRTDDAARRGATAIASNPVLVGVATTLVIVVAVFLAYNANAGLPWVPTYRLTAEVPSAASLVRGNEVRIGGFRAGVVDKITPVQKSNGTVAAKLDLKLETRHQAAAGRLHDHHPAALGARPQVRRGDARDVRSQGFPEGGAIPLQRGDAQAGRVRRVLQHVRQARRAIGEPAEPARLRRRLRRPRRGHQHGASRLFVPLVRDAVPVLSNIADAGHQLRPLLRLAGARRRDRRAGRGASRPSCGRTSTARSRRSRTSPGRSSRRRSRRARRACETAIETFPKIRPFFREHGGVLRRRCSPAPRRSTTPRRPRDRRSRRGIPALKASVGFNQRLEHVPRDLRDLRAATRSSRSASAT